MGVRMSEEEAWAYLEAGHTGVVTTVRRDGVPIPLPVWYVVDDRSIVFSTPARSKKVARVRHDPRATFLVEAGEHWRELSAVVAVGRCTVVEDPAEVERLRAALDAKYAAFRTAATAMPRATREHYATSTATLRLVPTEPLVTWDNNKLRIGKEST